jgi:hypothetical protein
MPPGRQYLENGILMLHLSPVLFLVHASGCQQEFESENRSVKMQKMCLWDSVKDWMMQINASEFPGIWRERSVQNFPQMMVNLNACGF